MRNISSLDKIMDGIDVNKIAIVTGSSSGIGLETSLTLAENNFTTYATMRNLDKASNILEVAERKNLPINVVQLDVTDDTSVQQAIQFVGEKEGRIDLLVNNAGYALLGAAEDLSSEDIQAQFNTNLFGVYRTIKEVIPIMRKQAGGGTIVNIGSVNGFVASPCASAYVATKFALEGLTQSLRYELAPFGIKVTIIDAGAIKTNIITNGMRIPKKIEERRRQQQKQQNTNTSPFAEMTINILEKSKTIISNGSHPRVVSDIVLKAAKAEKPQPRYPAGDDAEKLLETRRQMIDGEFEEFIQALLLEDKNNKVCLLYLSIFY
jgi:NAD(P)-dependent dehydrogenase (short-subunit alcohol dehydrogenase family)